ncbi:sulfite exporter TauE/SafE family protein [Halonotius terrestris]|uniref:Probable membrane transporter protein n=1 Tax=Halonotius terrestris TaxID=2487750 RepID=A0A8J8PAK7_9EURY|nr:sulfite exporter TauE/SafE family protein [Halonotius terrestris]TQQ82751.1 sulfite exporter TauE/SafE family protein [Halonotius terrestris]
MTRRSVGTILAVSTLGVFLFTITVSATETVAQAATTVPVDRLVAHWWVFPAAILFSTIALAAGVSGALFFTPFFLLVVGLTPAEAVGAGLLTELFGMSNGLRSYVKQGVVDYDTAKYLLAGAVPAVVVGAFAAHYIEPRLLKLAFGAGLVVLGGFLLYYDPPENAVPGNAENAFLERKNKGRGVTTIEATDGAQYSYETCWRPPGVALSTIGGFITGLISAGLPEIVTTQLIVRCRLPPRVAVATSVFVLAIAAAAGAAVHALTATPVWYVVAWSIPGVLVGGTVGTHVGKHLPSELMESGLGVVFGIVGLIVLTMEVMV